MPRQLSFACQQRTRLHAEQEARRKQAMTIGREKPPAKLHMQELRDMNQIELTQDDRDKRWNDANAVKKVIHTMTMCGHAYSNTTKDDYSYSPGILTDICACVVTSMRQLPVPAVCADCTLGRAGRLSGGR